MKNSVKALALAGVLMTGSVFASELRTPYLSERGPLRYDFFKLPKEDCSWWFTMWSAAHMKEAHKCYTKHGTDTQPLTTLIFNKSDFAFQDAFPGGNVPYDAENYSPFLKILKYSPRAEYFERGMTVGGRFEMPVWEKKGRVGVRFSVPFRKIEMERKDDTDLLQDPREQVTDGRYVTIDRNSSGLNAPEMTDMFGRFNDVRAIGGANATGTKAAWVTAVEGAVAAIAATSDGNIAAQELILLDIQRINSDGGIADGAQAQAAFEDTIANIIQPLRANTQSDNLEVQAYRFDFVRNMIDEAQKSEVKPVASPGVNDISIFGTQAAADNLLELGETGVHVALVGSNEVGEPLMHAFQVHWDEAHALNRSDLTIGIDAIKPIKTAGDQPTASTLGYFATDEGDIDYSKVIADYEKQLHGCGCPTGPGDSNYWLIFRRQCDGSAADEGRFGRGVTRDGGEGLDMEGFIRNRLDVYDEHPLLFLKKAGIEFETDMRTGIGDADLDIFYEHLFENDAMAQIFMGVRFPTASGHDSRKTGNPYRVHLGNGGHFEIKLGGEGAWQPIDWMNFKAHAHWSFVLEAEETRMATFTDSCVKNIGPCVKADVDWGYFTGVLDFNFFHPESSDICATIGYEFFYKTTDHVNYKAKSMDSFLGSKYKVEGAAPAPVNRTLVANPQTLGKKEAEANTERISHKVRSEASYRLSKYVDVFAGSSFVFAGQWAPRECDLHAGWNIRF